MFNHKRIRTRLKTISVVSFRYYFLSILLIGVAVSTTNFSWAVGGFITFVLAYLTKGSRNKYKKN